MAACLPKVIEADIAPFTSVQQLFLQPVIDFFPALWVNKGLHAVVPGVAGGFNRVDTKVVAILQFLPEGVPAVHLVIPRNSVEPEK